MSLLENFLRVPPDSTGKRVYNVPFIKLVYSGGLFDFKNDDVVHGETSGTVADVVHNVGTTTAGTVWLAFTPATPNQEYITGENLIVEGVTFAQCSDQNLTQEVYVPSVHLAGKNPRHIQNIDEKGAAFVRFAEGAPQVDSFGKLRTSESRTIGDYKFEYGILPNLFSDLSVTGTVAHDITTAGCLFTTGTASGETAVYTTDLYHTYQPGVSSTPMMSIAVGDMGKTNVTRRWGYFDSTDGLYFELEGTDLYVCRRSSTGAGLSRIIQADWNDDKLDGSGNGTNPTNATIDVSKINVYWMDIQWLGGGTVRFGAYINGERVTMHQMYHGNISSQTYMRTGSLPLRFEQENTGVAASTSEMRLTCCDVTSEGEFNPRQSMFCTDSKSTDAFPGSIYEKVVYPYPRLGRALLTVRPKTTYKTLTNRVNASLESISFVNTSDTPLIISLYFGVSLTGGTWVDIDTSNSAFEHNHGGEISFVYGRLLTQWHMAPFESKEVDPQSWFKTSRNVLSLGADGAVKLNISLTATAVTPIITVSGVNQTFADANPDTITRASGDFVADGVVVGMGVTVEGSASNDGQYVIDSVAATVLTLRSSDSLVSEGPVGGVTLYIGKVGTVSSTLTLLETT